MLLVAPRLLSRLPLIKAYTHLSRVALASVALPCDTFNDTECFSGLDIGTSLDSVIFGVSGGSSNISRV